MPSAVAAAVGVLQEGTRPVAELLIERLKATEMLLVLDNFEQVIAAAPFVSRLLAGCPKVKVIVTSRALLRLRGEHEFPVMPLEVLPAGGHVAGREPAGAQSFPKRPAPMAPRCCRSRARSLRPRATRAARGIPFARL